MAYAWAKSWGKAWGNSWGAIAEAATGGILGKPKHLPYKNHPWLSSPIRRYVEDVEPEVIEAVIAAVAQVSEGHTVQNADLETAQAERALRKFLIGQKQVWKEVYARLIRLEYERREQEYEDAQIALMLFEM